MDLGVYELTIAYSGFKTFGGSDFGVQANRVTIVDARLKVGSEAIAVQGNAEAELQMVKDGPMRSGNFLSREVS